MENDFSAHTWISFEIATYFATLLLLALCLFWSTCHSKDISSEFKEEAEENLNERRIGNSSEEREGSNNTRIRLIDADSKYEIESMRNKLELEL